MAGGMPYGLAAMLKEGHKHLSGLDEAVYKNIEACKQLSQITKSSMGPNGALCGMLLLHLYLVRVAFAKSVSWGRSEITCMRRQA